MSHSLAARAAVIFSQACWLNRCAAARFGWRAADTFLLGWAMTAPPIISREPRTTASVRVFSIWDSIIPELCTKRNAEACLARGASPPPQNLIQLGEWHKHSPD